ncbi:MAG: NAD-dependent epimerase/dehydratase family protein [Gemmatimonadetes bacterium]|nr:NAD-dependent epimerase/dehydratase family protein [Gemmatimonadota bacterium]
MRKEAVLVTGANGEIGHGLIERLAAGGDLVVALDIRAMDPDLGRRCHEVIEGSILDRELLDNLVSRYEFRAIYHLAALLSTRAEFTPRAGHDVNVQGTLNLLAMAAEQTEWSGRRSKFLFPSSIAVYGVPPEEKEALGRVHEKTWNLPTTMYGCNKAYCEHLGRYFSEHYKQLANQSGPSGVDFRALRYPGLISADTMPTGGTSDFIPEMVHAAAAGEPYACFVRPETRIPFMAMPDAIRALTLLDEADADQLTWSTYNVTSFKPSAGEFRELLLKRYPSAEITFRPDEKRQGIVDRWPADVNDDAARTDWGWTPKYGLVQALDDYLVPGIERHRESAG